ncbi:DMT family transporter [Candidatus Dependentiae bacterium]|nr:DMT family transporter [Candidatus Dependentiae bacterium]
MNIIFPIMAIFFYGLSPVFQKSALKRIPLPHLFFIHGCVIFILYSIIYVIFHDRPIDGNIIWAVFAGVSSLIGFIFFYEALKVGNASIVTAISSAYALVTVLLSMIFLKERITLIEIGGIVFIIFGIVSLNLSQLKNNNGKEKKVFNWKGILFPLLAAICWGAWGLFSKKAVSLAGEINTLVVFGIIAFIFFPLYGFIKLDRTKKIQFTKDYKLGILIGILSVCVVGTASFSFYFSVQFYRIAILAPIVSIYPGVTLIFSMLFLKEKINFKQIIFILLIILGVILLNITG